MSFDWDHVKTFLTVVEEGSLSGAARALGQTQPTVSRQIAALELALNAVLFERTGRSVVLTQFGQDLLGHVRAMARNADMISLAAMGQSQSVDGQVRVTASELMSAFVLPPLLRQISQQAPLLELHVIADNSVRDLVRREADIAIRHARPEQPNLFAKRLRDESMRFYACNAYIDAHGYPTKHSLSSHQIISYVDAEEMLSHLAATELNLTRSNFRFTSSSQLVALQMVRDGLGMAILPERAAGKLGDLVPVDIGSFELPSWLVTHSELKTSRRIRLVFDHIGDALS
ncbi:LysR family transcriptional regulator [Pseudooceanicola sp. MF1-13]|uniref:LysR family transcriptional regulator n=1 Tax=Pseudooceanicola sp. MF1-13 TaxID=3379095 RepID=UPI00389291DD